MLLAACALGASCDDSEPVARPPKSQASSTPVDEDAGPCAGQDDVVSSGKTQEGETQRFDVDGDGRADTVRFHLDFEEPVGCQAFLVVETSEGLFIEPVWVMGEAGGLPQPSLYAVAQVDGRPGFEIVVNEASGASTQFVAVYGYAGDELVALDAPQDANGLFGFGGSVGHLDAVDCLPDGRVVVSQAVPGDSSDALEDGTYEVTRRIYRAEKGRLTRVEVERQELPLERLNRFDEFRAGPFGSCPAP